MSPTLALGGLDLLEALLGRLVVGWLVSWWWVGSPSPLAARAKVNTAPGHWGKGRWVRGITTGGEVGG